MNPILDAVKGGPKTTLGVENGQMTMTVEASHLKPFDAKIADVAGVLMALGAVGAAGWLAIEDYTIAAALLFLGGLFGVPYLKRDARNDLAVKTIIRFTESSIAVKPGSMMNPDPEWKVFDSRLPHRFIRISHDRAQYEKDEHDFRRRTAPAARLTRYYSDAFIVVLEQLGQRHDIAEVMGAKRADEILARLALCDEYMRGVVNERQRLPMRPEDQWSGTTGSVPQ